MKSKISSSAVLFTIAGIAVVALLGYVTTRPSAPSAYDSFAQCLTDKGVKMYGAWWCPHCQAQKKLFGTAFKKVTSVECSPNDSRDMSSQCKDANIKGYPTWVFADGSRLEGERTFEALSTKSGCPIPPKS